LLHRQQGTGEREQGPHEATPLAEAPLVFLDLETTGLDPTAGHRVAEVALLRARAGQEEGRLESVVNPGRPLDPAAAAVNGLSDAALALAPPFALLAPAMERLAAGAVLVGHNVRFDLAFLSLELAAAGRPPLANPSLDTLALARRLLRRPSYSLAALAAELGLPAPTHQALDDVLATRALFAHLAALMAELGILTLGDALRLERGLLPGSVEPEPPPLVARAMAEGRSLRILYRSRGRTEAMSRVVRPIALTLESSGVYLRAFCELRQDVRAFALAKIEAAELL
jgi:DNA polymerase-3 subunit epsilon